MDSSTLLSLIIPAFNEEKLITATISRFIKYLSSKNYTWEIIVVDDGSVDQTSKKVRSLRNPKVRLITLERNQGKGAALKAGLLAAKGNFHIFSDADLSVPVENIEPFLEKLEQGNQVVIASRRVKGAKIKVHQDGLRENLGRGYTFLTQILIGSAVSDFTCGFKGFTKAASRQIFSRALVSRWAYDAEIIFLAQKHGYKILQYPVTWTNRKDTRVRLNKVILESLRDLVRIRIFDIQGKYD